jgi:hypothetical protein
MDTAYAQKKHTGRTEGASISLARSAGWRADRSPGRVKRAADRRPVGTSPSPAQAGQPSAIAAASDSGTIPR